MIRPKIIAIPDPDPSFQSIIKGMLLRGDIIQKVAS